MLKLDKLTPNKIFPDYCTTKCNLDRTSWQSGLSILMSFTGEPSSWILQPLVSNRTTEYCMDRMYHTLVSSMLSIIGIKVLLELYWLLLSVQVLHFWYRIWSSLKRCRILHIQLFKHSTFFGFSELEWVVLSYATVTEDTTATWKSWQSLMKIQNSNTAKTVILQFLLSRSKTVRGCFPGFLVI